ncbi:hypothetical protein RSO01_76530 [Reyranella soli]|uniref:Uncharacterized protein n=2 Tax=Reyranella soli TaxID=1230389 RepID=A0A512NNF5_9HYPH|nr:hypothetical protein RSO01_76530 [Reyranella soli]
MLVSIAASGQSSSDALSACSLPSYADRMRCLEKLAGEAPPPQVAATPGPVPAPAPAPAAASPPAAAATLPPKPAAPTAAASSKWIVSETRSPVDYSPVAIATASSGAGPQGVLQLSIQCRGGRTEMAIRSAPLMRRAEDHVVSYAINDAPPVTATTGLSSSGTGIALKGDVAGFLLSLPDQGTIAFRVAERQGETLEGRYDLADIKTLVPRLAGPCKWRRN